MKTIFDYLGKVSITTNGDYNKDIDYDRLCLVIDRTTYKTYISKKPVPRNTPITDESFWMPFASLKEEIVLDYNKFVELYGEKLKELDVIVKNALYFPKLDVENMHLKIKQIKDTNMTFNVDNNQHIHFLIK